MSHHHRDTEKQTGDEKPLHRRHSHHGQSHLRPSAVIDHLKTKVRRRRLSKHGSVELSDAISNQSENTTSISNTSEPTHYRPTTTVELHPTALETIFSYDGTDDIELNLESEVFIQNIEEPAFTPTPITTNDNDIEQTVQWRVNPQVSDTNVRRMKIKPIKAAKSLPEINNPSTATTTKKRRQTIKRTGFQIRDEDFSTIFNDLPSEEQLIIGFPCAWRKDVFMHGRMFLSVNYFCFYTCFFKWEESLCISYKDIISVTREKSARLLPNAIKIRTNNLEYFFVSTLPREKIFVAIFRLWQNALLEQPLAYQQLRAVIFADQQQTLDGSSGDSEESPSLENSPTSVHYSQSLPVASNRISDPPSQPTRISRRVVSLPPENKNTSNYLSSCNCESHLTRTFADRLFTFNVDTLFELLFGDNSFNRNFHNAQNLLEYTYGEWRLNKETGHREREVTYKTIMQTMLTSNTLLCREKQTLEVEKPNSIYILSSEVYNDGMKYTDTFYVATRFCMTQRDAEHCSLLVTAEVKYVKNVNSIIKTFIEKNAYSSIEGGVHEQVRRLENRQLNVKPHHSKRHQSESITPEPVQDTSSTSSASNISIKEKTITGRGFFYDLALFIGVFILLLHIYLCYKLYSMDKAIPTYETICFNRCMETCSIKQ